MSQPIDPEALEAAARALIDADPSMEGYHQVHIDAKMSDARAAISAFLEASAGKGVRLMPERSTDTMEAAASSEFMSPALARAVWDAMWNAHVRQSANA